ncbi:MAG: hypothetical protein ACI9KN_000431 [Gammaproteobacteria bacterium]|jgi:hypothetical protein
MRQLDFIREFSQSFAGLQYLHFTYGKEFDDNTPKYCLASSLPMDEPFGIARHAR